MTKTYHIRQPKLLRSNYLIFDGESSTLAGRLEYKGWIRRRASGVMGSQVWRFVRRFSLKRSLMDVLPADGDTPLLTYSCAALHQTGSLALHGQRLDFKVASLRSHYRWLDADGNELAVYKMRGFFRRSGSIEVSDALLQLKDYEALIPLGLYLGMDVEESNSSAVGAA